jgi:cell division septation protein DedD
MPEPKPEPEPEPAPSPQVPNGNVHIIAGCFSQLSNAKGMVTTAKEAGYDAKIIGEFGGLHFVSAQSYSSEQQAANNLSKIRQFSSGAWIMKR